ncbi:MAG TPA: lysine-2,3-aminomutase-like protein [Beijerinckiaceae bacterium]|nr:lysine-2,3-aminomutase-like protein [Beijerinckiaceae bacterium]
MTRPLRSIDDLIAAGLADADDRVDLHGVAARYAVAVTPAMAALIDTAAPDDPIALQFVPRAQELIRSGEETDDPIADHPHAPVKGIVHRYADRVLLKATHTCPVYCRFCFRREMVGPDGDGTLTRAEIDAALAYVAARPAIREVIVTGGDPFVLSERRIAAITAAIAALPHVETIRWHSRVPVVEPERVTSAFVDALTRPAGRTRVTVAIHANHAREFSPEAQAAVARLAEAGITLLSQSVLLRGVNDRADVLADLVRAFHANRIRPYYLHHGDLAPGTGHFRLPLAEGLKLVEALRSALAGMTLPTYVLDLPGGHGKVPVARALPLADGRFLFTDHSGRGHVYPPRWPETEKAAAVSG